MQAGLRIITIGGSPSSGLGETQKFQESCHFVETRDDFSSAGPENPQNLEEALCRSSNVRLRWNPKQIFKDTWARLQDLRDAPHAVAGGVAIGIFWGFTPLTGLKTLLSMLSAWMLRCSKFPAVIAVALHDVLIPIWPIILRWEYQIGFWMLHHQMPPRLSVGKLKLAELFHWKTLELIWPTFLGSCVIGLPCALITYYVVEWALERYETSHHRHLTPPP